MLKLYNTLTKQLVEVKPLDGKTIRMYSCGPTVYHFAHIGNLRTYIFTDLLRRTIEYSAVPLKQAMNITDVGHLVGDGDEGEDKLEVGAAREGKHPLEIAKFYEEKFFQDMEALNIEMPHDILRATDAIPEQIEIIKELEARGFTYQDEFAVYFDTSKLSDYGKLSGQKLTDKKVGARDEVVIDTHKKNPQDFVLWFFLKGRYENHILHWPSPWGEGFPGWHIECSAISRKLLGQPFDIHTGGVDHIGTHHTNEIAQSEAAFDLPLAALWAHGEFLLVNAGRMGKSEGNFITLSDVIEKGFTALEYRYFCLGAHYRTQLNFTWENLQAARTALNKLYTFAVEYEPSSNGVPAYELKFAEAINNDLNIPQALAVVWEMLGDASAQPEEKKNSLMKFDRVLGLRLDAPPRAEIPLEIHELAQQREQARQDKDFTRADVLRQQINSQGYEVKDTPAGPKISKI